MVISKTWLAAENDKLRAIAKLEEAKESLVKSTHEWSKASDEHNELKEQKEALLIELQVIYKRTDENIKVINSSHSNEAEKVSARARVKDDSLEEERITKRKIEIDGLIKSAYSKSLQFHKKYKEEDKLVKDLTTKIHLLELKLKGSSKDYKDFLLLLVKALTKRKKFIPNPS